MHSLKHSKSITESFATNSIFDACRANEARENVGNVVFSQFGFGADDEYIATLYRFHGNEIIAMAIVNKWDV